MRSQNTRWVSASISTLAVGAVLALGAGMAASAAPAASSVDPAQKGTIVVHKLEQPATPTGIPNNGKTQDVSGLTPIDGVTYSVQQIDPATYDLTSNAGWNALKTLTPAAASTAAKGYTTSITTGADSAAGVATAAELPLGVYLLTETAYPAGVTAGAPFLVTVPMTDPDALDTWMYTVNVYPKNAKIGGGEKTVDDTNAKKVGDAVEWTILGDIPTSETIDGYRIVDPLDSRLTYQSTAVDLDNGVALTKDVDYTLTEATTGTPAATTVTVTFLAPGLAKLAANNTAHVRVVIATVINAAGDIPNQAIIYPNEASFDIAPGEPGGPVVTPTPETKFGNVTLKKVSAKDNSALRDAEFKVFLTEADATAGTNAITISGTSVWTTDDQGLVTISGLRQSGWSEGASVNPGEDGFQYYWVAEIKAPTGYELLAQPVRVTVGDVDTTVDFTIENSPSNGGFQLPFTGSALSAGLFYGAGGLLLAGIVVMVIRARRKESVEA